MCNYVKLWGKVDLITHIEKYQTNYTFDKFVYFYFKKYLLVIVIIICLPACEISFLRLA